MLVVTRFDVPPAEADAFLLRAQAALEAFAARPGYLRGRIGRAADDPAQWVLTTEWEGVGAYRRSLGAYDVKVHGAPLLAMGRDEPSAFEVLVSLDGEVAVADVSRRARDAGTVRLGEASAPVVPPA